MKIGMFDKDDDDRINPLKEDHMRRNGWLKESLCSSNVQYQDSCRGNARPKKVEARCIC
jgi:hypothetical protein